MQVKVNIMKTKLLLLQIPYMFIPRKGEQEPKRLPTFWWWLHSPGHESLVIAKLLFRWKEKVRLLHWSIGGIPAKVWTACQVWDGRPGQNPRTYRRRAVALVRWTCRTDRKASVRSSWSNAIPLNNLKNNNVKIYYKWFILGPSPSPGVCASETSRNYSSYTR